MKRHWSWWGILSLAGMLVGCAGSSTTTTMGIAPNQVGWCDQPIIAFEDDGVSPAANLATWDQAQGLLGFVPLLPARIPGGACLASAGGVVRNPVFGARFNIIYELPQSGALTLAETPQQQGNGQMQCSAVPSTTTTLATCQQTLHGLNVTMLSTLSLAQVRALLTSVQPNAAWVPINTA